MDIPVFSHHVTGRFSTSNFGFFFSPGMGLWCIYHYHRIHSKPNKKKIYKIKLEILLYYRIKPRNKPHLTTASITWLQINWKKIHKSPPINPKIPIRRRETRKKNKRSNIILKSLFFRKINRKKIKEIGKASVPYWQGWREEKHHLFHDFSPFFHPFSHSAGNSLGERGWEKSIGTGVGIGNKEIRESCGMNTRFCRGFLEIVLVFRYIFF